MTCFDAYDGGVSSSTPPMLSFVAALTALMGGLVLDVGGPVAVAAGLALLCAAVAVAVAAVRSAGVRRPSLKRRSASVP